MTDEQNTPKNIPTEDYSILPQQVTEALISAAAAARKDTDPNGPAPDLTVQQALEILNNAENIDEPIKRLARAAQAKVKIQALEDALNVRRKRATRRKKQPESIDIEKWITDTEATAAALEESNKALAQTVQKTMEKIENIAADKNSAIRNAIFDSQEKIDLVMDAQQVLRKSMEEAAPTIKGIGDTVAGVVRQYAGIEKFITALNESMPDWLKIAIADYVELKPYLMAELEKPEYEGATLEELMNAPALDKNGEPSKSALLLERAMTNAREAQQAEQDKKPLPPHHKLNLQQFAENALPSVKYIHNGEVELSVDKVATYFSALIPNPKDVNGQRTFNPVKYERDGTPEITLETWYSFDQNLLQKLGIKQEINDFDFFVELACYNLLAAGNRIVSISQIYKWLNGNKAPNKRHIASLTNSIKKQLAVTVGINDKQLMEAWGEPVPETYHEITGPLLPVIIETEHYRANGTVTEGIIKILDYPPLLTIGKKIGQFTTIPKALLENNISHSKWYYPTMHWLITNIARMKNGTREKKFLYSTFYKDLKINPSAANVQKNAKAKLYEILDHFVECGWIKRYKEEVTPSTGEVGVRIYFDKEKEKALADKKKSLALQKRRSKKKKDSDISEKR